MKNRFKIGILMALPILIATGAWAQDFMPDNITMRLENGFIGIARPRDRKDTFIIRISQDGKVLDATLTRNQIRTIIFVLQRYSK